MRTRSVRPGLDGAHIMRRHKFSIALKSAFADLILVRRKHLVQSIVAEFFQKPLDIDPRESLECIEAQGRVLCEGTGSNQNAAIVAMRIRTAARMITSVSTGPLISREASLHFSIATYSGVPCNSGRSSCPRRGSRGEWLSALE